MRVLVRPVLFSLALGVIAVIGFAGPAAAQQTGTDNQGQYPPKAPITVTAPTQKLAFTGSNSTFPFAAAGVALVLVGSVLTVGMRRRRTAHTLKV